MNNLNSKDPYPMAQVDMAWIGTKFAEVHVLLDLMDESIKNLTKAMSNMVRGKNEPSIKKILYTRTKRRSC